jgi:hypothetical protein
VVVVAAAVVVVTVCPLQSGVRSAPYHEVDPGRWAPDHDDAAFRPFRSDDVSPAGLEYAGLGRASASSPSTLFLAVVVAGRGHGCRSEDDFGSRSLLATVEAGTYTKEKAFCDRYLLARFDALVFRGARRVHPGHLRDAKTLGT